jgi:Ser/Thr protein kinase RdoA (MazF antagonist)
MSAKGGGPAIAVGSTFCLGDRERLERWMAHWDSPAGPHTAPEPLAPQNPQVLLDVATALQYLHDSTNLVHGDIKIDNVLLKSDATHPRGFLVK